MPAKTRQPKAEAKKVSANRKAVAKTCDELRDLQRQRVWYLKSRNMVMNRLRATVAGLLGYQSSLTEEQRLKLFTEADDYIKNVVNEQVASDHHGLIMTTWTAVSGFDTMKDMIEKEQVKLARQLPIVSWVEEEWQRGFGVQGLATVIGETGNLYDYANPAKVWKRMGCAPYVHNGKVLMGATWKSGSEGKLPAEEWEKFGYSPRRRSIAYLIGEGLVKQNGSGPYRARYLEAKVRAFETHPEWKWTKCDKCKGNGNGKGPACATCGGTGVKCLRAHRHGMLLATKLLLKNLWIEWQAML